MMSKLMRTPEVAELLGVPEATLRYWRFRGEGPKSFTLGRKNVVYREDDVEAYLKTQYAATVRGA